MVEDLDTICTSQTRLRSGRTSLPYPLYCIRFRSSVFKSLLRVAFLLANRLGLWRREEIGYEDDEGQNEVQHCAIKQGSQIPWMYLRMSKVMEMGRVDGEERGDVYLCGIHRCLDPPGYIDAAYVCRADGFVLAAPALVVYPSAQSMIGRASLAVFMEHHSFSSKVSYPRYAGRPQCHLRTFQPHMPFSRLEISIVPSDGACVELDIVLV